MALARTVLTIMICLAVAALPASAGLAGPRAMGASTSAADNHATPCNKAVDDCGSFGACAIKCFNYIGSIPDPLIVPVFAKAAPWYLAETLRPIIHVPPLPPPRI